MDAPRTGYRAAAQPGPLLTPLTGTVVSLHISAAAAQPTQAMAQVHAVPGRGLEGDRYWASAGTYSGKGGAKDAPDRNLTLLEHEALQALARDYGLTLDANEARRNIVVGGAALNHYVGRVFRIGRVKVRGLRLCEPCRHLERLTGKKAFDGLVHRGGLRCEILTDGVIAIGDRLEE